MPPHSARRAISAVFFVDGAALGGWAAHIADAKHLLQLGDGQLGVLLLASSLGAVTTMPLTGWLIHRFGSRNLSIVSGFALCLATACLFLAPSFPAFFAMLVLVGITNGQMDVAMNSHSMAVQDRFDRPMLSAVHGWFSVGGFAGGAGASLAARFGVPPLAHLAIAAVVLATVLFVAGRHLLPSEVDQSDGEGGGRLALPHGVLWLLGVMVLFSFVGEGAVWDWSSVYLRDDRDAAPWLGSLGFGLASLAMATARFVGDAWTHALGPRKLLIWSTVAGAIGIVLAVSAPTTTLAIIGFVVTGVGLANVVPIIFRSAASVPGVSAGYGLAAVTTCGYSGFLGGPPLVGLIAHAKSLSFALGLVAILLIAVAIAAPYAVRDQRAEGTIR